MRFISAIFQIFGFGPEGAPVTTTVITLTGSYVPAQSITGSYVATVAFSGSYVPAISLEGSV